MRNALARIALIDVSEDDDLSEIVDMGAGFHLCWVGLPTLTSTTVTIEASTSLGNEEPTEFYDIADDITDGAGTGGEIVPLDLATDLRPFRWFRVSLSAGQAADREIVLGGLLV